MRWSTCMFTSEQGEAAKATEFEINKNAVQEHLRVINSQVDLTIE